MSALQLAAAALCAGVALAHSWLGERYILIRLLRRADLPHLFGSDLFTRRTLRFAWHLTSVAWLGFGALLVVAARGAEPAGPDGLRVVAATFAASALVTLVGSRGRHLAWVLFAAIAALAWLAAGDVRSAARARLVARPTLDLQAGRDSLSAFFVLGFLDEYLGRQIVEGSDLVERFSCSEAAAADTFEAALLDARRRPAPGAAAREDDLAGRRGVPHPVPFAGAQRGDPLALRLPLRLGYPESGRGRAVPPHGRPAGH